MWILLMDRKALGQDGLLSLLPFSTNYHTNATSPFKYHLGLRKRERLRPQLNRNTVSPNKGIQKDTSVCCLPILLVMPERWVWDVIFNVTGVLCMIIRHGPLQPGGRSLAVKLTLVFKQLQNSILHEDCWVCHIIKDDTELSKDVSGNRSFNHSLNKAKTAKHLREQCSVFCWNKTGGGKIQISKIGRGRGGKQLFLNANLRLAIDQTIYFFLWESSSICRSI